MQKTHSYQAVFGPLKPAEMQKTHPYQTLKPAKGTKGREEVQIKTTFLRELGINLEVVILAVKQRQKVGMRTSEN